MTELPPVLEFGNRDHIAKVAAWERETFAKTYLDGEKKKQIIRDHWKFHRFSCDSCGSDVEHCGDKDPEIEIVEIRETEFDLILRCDEGVDCDETVEVTIQL